MYMLHLVYGHKRIIRGPSPGRGSGSEVGQIRIRGWSNSDPRWVEFGSRVGRIRIGGCSNPDSGLVESGSGKWSDPFSGFSISIQIHDPCSIDLSVRIRLISAPGSATMATVMNTKEH